MKKLIVLALLACMVLAVPAMASAYNSNLPEWIDVIERLPIDSSSAVVVTDSSDDFFVYKDAVVLAQPDAAAPVVEVPAAGAVATLGIAALVAGLGCAVLPRKEK